VLLRAMLYMRRGLITIESNDSAVRAATASLYLAINRNRILDNVSTRGDADACSRASRANFIIFT
jgi:hypothetical protein